MYIVSKIIYEKMYKGIQEDSHLDYYPVKRTTITINMKIKPIKLSKYRPIKIVVHKRIFEI